MPRRMSLPLGTLPPGATAIRLQTTQEIYWDRLAIAYAIGFPLLFAWCLGALIILPAMVVGLAYSVLATMAVSDGKVYRYPYTLRLIQ